MKLSGDLAADGARGTDHLGCGGWSRHASSIDDSMHSLLLEERSAHLPQNTHHNPNAQTRGKDELFVGDEARHQVGHANPRRRQPFKDNDP